MANIEDVSHLLKVMKQLRDPVKGCAWDLEQDHSSLIPYLEEESQELIKAIESNDSDGIKEELGDVLLQVIFHSQIAHENKEFDFFDVVEVLKEKLIRRHPFVFDKSKKHTKEEQKAMWEKIKRTEKGG